MQPALIEKDIKTDELTINMGPQHPSTHGVLRVILKTDGEICLDAQPDIGYLHRCAEKIAENLNYGMFVPYTDRMDYVSGMGCNLGYCIAVEQLTGIQIPPRGDAKVDSLAPLWSGANWHERECFDLSGVTFTGHPDLRRILCAPDWEGHALRKDYKAPDYYHGIQNNVNLIDLDHRPPIPEIV